MEGTEPVLAKPMAPPPKVTVPRMKDVVANGEDVAAYSSREIDVSRFAPRRIASSTAGN